MQGSFGKMDSLLFEKLQQHYSIKTVSEIYELSEKTIRKWIRTGKLRAHKIGGSVRIPKSELVRLVEEWTEYQ